MYTYYYQYYYRSRYLSAITGMTLIAELPGNVLFRVLSEKILITSLMPLINDVNCVNTNARLKWILADEDWRLWQVQIFLFCLHFFLSFSLSLFLLPLSIVSQDNGSPRLESGFEILEPSPGVERVEKMVKVESHLNI